jgi:hypothetical protein
MSYAECRDGVQAILQALTGTFINTWQVTIGDYQVLDKGLPPAKPYAAVLTAGSFESDEAISGQICGDKHKLRLCAGCGDRATG